MRPRRLIFLAALLSEAKAIEKAIGNVVNVQIHIIGMRAVRSLPLIFPEDTVVVAGLGGALDPTLKIGDLVLDTPVGALPPSLTWRIGPIHSSEFVVNSPRDKADLFAKTKALAVDLEQERVREGLPPEVRLIGLRSISDSSDFAIEPVVEDFIDEVGRPQTGTIISSILKRPRLIPHLLRLNANYRKALENLGLGAASLVIRFTHVRALR
jgi:hypothetical protein